MRNSSIFLWGGIVKARNILNAKSFSYVLANILAKGLTSIIFIFLGFVLTPENYGRFSLLYSFQTAMMAFCGVGVFEMVVGDLNKFNSHQKKQLLFANSLGTFLITSIISFSIFLCYIIYNNDSSISISGVVLALLTGLLLSFFLMQANYYRILENYNKSILLGVGVSFCSILLLLVSSLFTEYIDLIFFYSLIFLIIFLFYSFRNRLLFIRIVNPFSNFSSSIITIWPYAVTAFFGWLSGYGMNIFIYKYVSMFEISKYTFLLTVSGVVQLVATSINMVWAPVFYKFYLNNDFVTLRRREKLLFQIMALVILLIGVFIYLMTPIINKITNGEGAFGYLNSRSELLLLLFGYLLTIPWWKTQNYFHINKAGVQLMRLNLVYGSIGIGLWFMSIYYLDVSGIYIGFVLQAFIKSVGISIYSYQKWMIKQSIIVLFTASLIFLLLIFS